MEATKQILGIVLDSRLSIEPGETQLNNILLSFCTHKDFQARRPVTVIAQFQVTIAMGCRTPTLSMSIDYAVRHEQTKASFRSNLSCLFCMGWTAED
jgi:hypothetical protein